MEKIGVIGAGVMGRGVAQRLASYGYKVELIDLSDAILNKALKAIKTEISLYNLMNDKKKSKKAILANITTSIDYGCLKDVDLVIENITEKISQKEKLYRELSDVLKPECLVFANTSCISITKLASCYTYHSNVIGVHFMNPVTQQHHAEVIRGMYSSEKTIRETISFLQNVQISCTVVEDAPGFVSNRLSHIFMNEAANVVMEGIATAEAVDELFTEAFHHEMGPLHTADLIGIDTVVDSLDVLFESYHDPKYRCSILLRKMVDAGLLGRKTGQGFFKY